jgi:hypothetical protein
VHSATRGMDPPNRKKVLLGPSVGIVSIKVSYREEHFNDCRDRSFWPLHTGKQIPDVFLNFCRWDPINSILFDGMLKVMCLIW